MIKADYSKENLEKLVKESWCFTDLSKKLGVRPHIKRLKQKLDKLNIDYSHFRKQKPKTKDDYNLDHIIPRAKGGLNTIDNLAIVTPITNKVKSDLTKEELLDFCEKILKYNGYNVYKPIIN